MQNFSDLTRKKFLNYLSSLGISQKSHKNYKSDINHFLSWLKIHIKSFGASCESLDEAFAFLKPTTALSYREEMAKSSVPHKTINRRLSTLRHFSRFMTISQILDFNFMEGIENVAVRNPKRLNQDGLIGEFRAHLAAQKASANTIKNYLSDINQFLSWLDKEQKMTLKN